MVAFIINLSVLSSIPGEALIYIGARSGLFIQCAMVNNKAFGTLFINGRWKALDLRSEGMSGL